MKKITILTTLLLVNLFSFSQVQIVFQDFEGASKPSGWRMIDANIDIDPTLIGVHAWTFGSNDLSGNVVEDFTTNAAIFDDDAAGDTGNNNNVWLFTDKLEGGGGTDSAVGYDVSAFDQITLTYDYALEVLSPGSEKLSVGIYDRVNSEWLILRTYDTTTNPTQDSIDITAALNANPQLDPTDFIFGFNYNDINAGWAWSAGIDNVSLVGTNLQPTNDIFFRHIVTAENVSGSTTTIDHPELNNKPDATILIAHNFSGATDNIHDHTVEFFYDNFFNKWRISNEDFETMTINSEFNIYIAGENANAFNYTATQENINNDEFLTTTIVAHPDIDNNPDAMLFMSHQKSSTGDPNDIKYAFAYIPSFSKWEIWTEDLNAGVVVDSKYKILIEPSVNDATTFRHTSNASNINGSYTFIDHPLLNNNPNATFIFNHVNNIDRIDNPNNKNMGVFYNNVNWTIYNEDFSDMPEGLTFNILVKNDNTASVNDNEFANFNVYPNPVEDTLTIDVSEEITQVKIVNLLGQEVITTKSLANNSLDVSTLDKGIYFVKITVNNKEYSKKIIKK